jgi:predicted DNA-binding antitoxin AbrB/MazE fold protein
MSRVIHAVFEKGVFRPTEEVDFPEHQEVEILIHGDIPTQLIAVAGESGGSFDFLSDPREDEYAATDGKSV